MKECKKCNVKKKIVNSHFELCLICNKNRLSATKQNEDCQNVTTEKKTKVNKNKIRFDIDKNKPNKTKNISKDEEFYKECFNLSEHKCEECNKGLPNYFRNDDGRVAARYRYSHIVPKSVAPELRYSTKNINHLCLKCHSKWENGDSKSMKIYPENKERLKSYFNL